MKDALTQLDIRENTASSRRHASRPAVDSPRSISTKPLARRLQDRLQTLLLASGTRDADSSVNNTPPEAATGEENRPSAETLPGRTAVVTAEGLRQVAETPEPFVSADEAAQFLSVNRRYLLELSRGGIAGAYALGTGRKRKIWVFRLSELAASIVRNETSISKPQKPCTIGSGSPR
jgi:hypothetical protein